MRKLIPITYRPKWVKFEIHIEKSSEFYSNVIFRFMSLQWQMQNN
jgi:hypothetical protein